MEKLVWIKNKIYNREALPKQCTQWRLTGHKLVFTNGVFDILHYGHLNYLAQAADCGNKLIVGVNADASVKRLKGAERPINVEQDRLFQLASILVVDAVCLFEEDTPLNLVQLIKPDVIVKGGDYAIDQIVGAKEVCDNGGEAKVIPFSTGYSTTSLIELIKKL